MYKIIDVEKVYLIDKKDFLFHIVDKIYIEKVKGANMQDYTIKIKSVTFY